jgi:hypothetical protein
MIVFNNDTQWHTYSVDLTNTPLDGSKTVGLLAGTGKAKISQGIIEISVDRESIALYQLQ